MARCIPCESREPSTVVCESLPSSLENFTNNFFGTLQKTIVNGRVVWILPCDLDVGLPGNPRLEGEGLACYFLRMLNTGITGLVGEKGGKGDAGDNGTNGENAFSMLADGFTQPSEEEPNFSVELDSVSWCSVGQTIFIDTSGWHSIVSIAGNILNLNLVSGLVAGGTEIATGLLVSQSGPQGLRGPQGITDEDEVRNTILTGLSVLAGGDVVATDTVLVAFGRLEKRMVENDAKISYTDALARAAISVTFSSPLSYNSATGEIGIFASTANTANYLVQRGGSGEIEFSFLSAYRLTSDATQFQVLADDGAPLFTAVRGSNAISFFDGTPQPPPIIGPAASDPTSTQALANSIRTAMLSYGMVV